MQTVPTEEVPIADAFVLASSDANPNVIGRLCEA